MLITIKTKLTIIFPVCSDNVCSTPGPRNIIHFCDSRVQEGDQDLRLFESFNAQVYSNGFIRWSIRAMLKTTCSMRLADFPWDTQICNVTMASWLYDSSKVTIKVSVISEWKVARKYLNFRLL